MSVSDEDDVEFPYVDFSPPPGLNADVTALSAGQRWVSGNRIRWRDGYAEPIGGWEPLVSTPVEGKPRNMTAWSLQDGGTRNIGIGTHRKLYVLQGGQPNDITPIRRSVTLTDPFDTTNGSSVVEVTDTGHEALSNDVVRFSNATAVGGLTIDGDYQIIEIIDGNTYTIDAGSNATSTASGGGSVDAEYEMNAGSEDNTLGLGWGAGAWGEETWGTPRSTSSIRVIGRNWSLDAWGDDLIACASDEQTVYQWTASTGVSVRAAPVANAPKASFIIVAPEQQTLFALGADENPLNIAWSDRGDLTEWTASATTTAGSKLLYDGSTIVTAVRSRGEVLVMTDRSLYSVSYVGGDAIWGFQRIGRNGGIVGENAIAEINGITYWMGNGRFYAYDGVIRPMSCPNERYVFDNMRRNQEFKVTCGINAEFNEIWWFYPDSRDTDTTENSRYIVYNYEEGHWHFGVMPRGAWIDSGVYRRPLAVSSEDGLIHFQETGDMAYTDPLRSYLVSGDVPIMTGSVLQRITQILPDVFFKDQTPTAYLDFSIRGRRYTPADKDYQWKGPYRVTSFRSIIRPRLRCRYASFIVQAGESLKRWRLGRTRLRLNGAGRR